MDDKLNPVQTDWEGTFSEEVSVIIMTFESSGKSTLDLSIKMHHGLSDGIRSLDDGNGVG